MKRTEIDYTNETTVKTIKILEVLEFEPASIKQIVDRVGAIPNVKLQLKYDAAMRILKTLQLLEYAETADGKWRKGFKTIK
jgi:hypothetical protein